MLVLSRKPSETILIGNDIRVTVVGIGTNNVRIGIDAPPETVILRKEVPRKQETTTCVGCGTCSSVSCAR